MAHTMRQVLAEALALPPVDHLWAQEAEERIDAYERGEIGSSPALSVFEKINAGEK